MSLAGKSKIIFSFLVAGLIAFYSTFVFAAAPNQITIHVNNNTSSYGVQLSSDSAFGPGSLSSSFQTLSAGSSGTISLTPDQNGSLSGHILLGVHGSNPEKRAGITLAFTPTHGLISQITNVGLNVFFNTPGLTNQWQPGQVININIEDKPAN